jgi:hypothetical protein
MAYTQSYDNLWVITLNAEGHARTCNYWYLIQSNHGPHTAFTSREHMLAWLEQLGLSLTTELPEHGEWSHQKVTGAYRTALHGDMAAFNALSGLELPALQNGDYTKTVITLDADGICTKHQLNPNVRNRPVYDYRASQALVG